MDITFFGAAKTTTGSMHLVEVGGRRILLDCGLYQGKRKDAFEKNRNLPFDPKTIHTVILSHAHMDHSGNIPSLVKRGFRGEIFCTPATMDLCEIMLRDSAFLQVKDVEFANKRRGKEGKNLFEPLYTADDVEDAMDRFRGIPYELPFDVAPGVKATFHNAGHLLGSAGVTIDVPAKDGGTKRLFFTGDMGRKDMPILWDPTVVHDVDVLITESTYGNRTHPPRADVMGRLKGFIEDITMQRAKLIIPSFSVGRTQEIVYYLNEIYEQGRIPSVPIFVDSPLSSKATEVFERHQECFDAEASKKLMEGNEPFHFKGLRYVTDTAESKKLNDMPGPMVIIASSGMCEGGRIVHHLMNNLGNPRNVILFVGYQAENTLGRRIVEHVSPVRMFGQEFEVAARIHTINALSAHADRDEMADYFTEMGPSVEKAFVVHGELEQNEGMAEVLRKLGAREIVIPDPGQKFVGVM